MTVPAHIAAQGRQLIALGEALLKPETTVEQLVELASQCGLTVHVEVREQVQHQESGQCV